PRSGTGERRDGMDTHERDRRGGLTRVAAVAVAAGVAGGAAVYGVERATEGSGEPAATVSATAPATTATDEVGGGTATGWTAVVRRASPGVVSITSVLTVTADPGFPGAPPETRQETAAGTGFVIDASGDIVTSQHVVADATSITVRFADGTSAKATVRGTDATTDLAVIRVKVAAATLHPLTLGSAAGVRVGDPVLAIGNPFGYDRSASAGIVSGLGREIQSPNGFTLVDAIQTDAAVNHGNSGGPLLDAAGRVIGVNAQIADSGVDANVGVAFAVPMDAGNRRVIAQLRDAGKVSHAWLGIAGQTIDARLAQEGRVPVSAGVLVTGTVAGGPAADAGIDPGTDQVTVDGAAFCVGGDVITSIDGRAIASMADLQGALEASRPGAEVAVRVVHADGEVETVRVTLGAQPATAPSVTSGC
ncbi:MAG: trypsin-like peptidase domain-containing protein, partial [Actinomycetota bacterium]